VVDEEQARGPEPRDALPCRLPVQLYVHYTCGEIQSLSPPSAHLFMTEKRQE
jgi:hypothetical protein